jgi:hypothetical protein
MRVTPFRTPVAQPVARQHTLSCPEHEAFWIATGCRPDGRPVGFTAAEGSLCVWIRASGRREFRWGDDTRERKLCKGCNPSPFSTRGQGYRRIHNQGWPSEENLNWQIWHCLHTHLETRLCNWAAWGPATVNCNSSPVIIWTVIIRSRHQNQYFVWLVHNSHCFSNLNLSLQRLRLNFQYCRYSEIL